MANPLKKIKKLKGRSWAEIRTRGKQAFSAYSEQIGLSGKLPESEELPKLVLKSEFSDGIVTAETLLKKFYEKGNVHFFPSFFDIEKTIESFRKNFGKEAAEPFIRKADKATEGKFDLFGYRNLDFGASVDWHYEPLSGKKSPLKHWKLFDELDSAETGDKKIIWEINRHQHFFTLGVAYQLTGDEKYAATFVRHIDSWMEQNSPGIGINWASSLEVSFRLISWIWAFHFFKGSQSFTHGVFQKALRFLISHGWHLEQYLSTFYSPNTHLTGEALGLYYLGTQLSFLERAEYWRERGKEILLEQMQEQIFPDGVYFEQSTWYQRYTSDFYIHFYFLQRLFGEKVDNKTEEKLLDKIQSSLDFLMHITRPDGKTPIIGDDDGGRLLPLTSSETNDFRGTLSAGAVLFSRDDYKFVSEHITQEILWLFGTAGIDKFESLDKGKPFEDSKAFADGGYFVMRDGWAETDNYLLIDAGEVGALSGGHGHADTLGFELAISGKTLLVDSGTYTYHQSSKIRDFFRSSHSHNTLMIDEKSSSEFGGKFSWESKAEAKVHSWVSQERFNFFEGSHNGYKRLETGEAEHTRSILFLKNEYWIMRDFVNTLGKHSYQLNFNFNSETNPSIKESKNGNTFVDETDQKGNGMFLQTFGDNGEWERQVGWISTLFGQKIIAPVLRFLSKGKGPQEFFTFMIPCEQGFQKPEVLETEVPGGRAFVINYRDYQDLFVFADDQLIRTEIFNTDFRFLWARLSRGDALPEEFVLVDGKQFSLGGRMVFDHPQKLEFATARRFGHKLYVRTSKGVFNVSIPKNNSKAYVLKTLPED